MDGVAHGHGRVALEVELAAKVTLPFVVEIVEVLLETDDAVAGPKDLIGSELPVHVTRDSARLPNGEPGTTRDAEVDGEELHPATSEGVAR